MPERSRRPVGKPWIAMGLGGGVAISLVVWTVRRGKPVEKPDDWRPLAAASSVSLSALPPLDLPVHVYDSHLAHLRFVPDGSASLAFGSEGSTLRSTDDGQSWQAVPVPTRQFLAASVADTRAGSVIVVGSRGAILRSEDNGQSFSAVPLDTEASFRAVALAADGGQILAVGDGGVAYVSRDGGRSFAAEATPRSDYLSHVVALPNRARFVVAGDNGALLLRDEGAGWRSVPTNLTPQQAGLFMALSVLPSGKLLAGTQGGSVLSSEDDGDTWRETFEASPGSFVASFHTSETGELIAARMRRGDLLLSMDAGTTFEVSPVGIKPGVATLDWSPGRGFVGVA